MTSIHVQSKSAGAMLGAAYGDALGWPNERISKSDFLKQSQESLEKLRGWVRRSGCRFTPFEEPIEAGGYSDDTQLILCMSRALLKGDKWWDYYTQVELPFWSTYERGGGGATKRAVELWLNGYAPWSPSHSAKDVKKYFDAGGNGVAMRVLPHILFNPDKDFHVIGQNIFLDGITTHGHPRAILGALSYGFALHFSFNNNEKLKYGALVNELIKNTSVWALGPQQIANHHPDWHRQIGKYHENYHLLWEAIKSELLGYLEICRSELSRGALSYDDNVLEQLHCFDKKISGAGTVAAISSIYLASRYAADPTNGVVKAAFSHGADTDTIASMTGGLLGCISGAEWVSPFKAQIQDVNYIERIASQLIENKIEDTLPFNAVKHSRLKQWKESIDHAATQTYLPDRRLANVRHLQSQTGRSGKYKVDQRKFIISDGQTMYVNVISKHDFKNDLIVAPQNAEDLLGSNLQLEKQHCGPKIIASSMENSLSFFTEILGLTIKKKAGDAIVFNQGLVLAPLAYARQFSSENFRSVIYIEVTNIYHVYEAIKIKHINIITPLDNWAKSQRSFFRCEDFDGNIIEIFECLPTQLSNSHA